MEFLEPSYHHFHQQQHHDQLAHNISYSNAQHNMHNFAMAAQHSAMIGMPPSGTKPNETKPRLGKDEVEILEREFQANPKPTTQTKRQFAEDMGVDLARINNWFQNRRAKRKQEKKQEAYDASQAQDAASGYSEPSSPDFLNSSQFFEPHPFALQHSATFPMMNGPPPPVAPINPQYSDPSSASLQSLQRTLAAAEAAQQHEYQSSYLGQTEAFMPFDNHLVAGSSSDRAHFPSAESQLVRADNSDVYTYGSSMPNTLYRTTNQSMPELASPAVTNTPTGFNTYSNLSPTENHSLQSISTFPSQLLIGQNNSGLPIISRVDEDQHSEIINTQTANGIDFKYDVADSDPSSSISPPPSSIPFKSPLPMDIASRRKKVHVKPAALTADTLKSRPSMGPRTVSHAEGFRRASDSPMGSPMRRIASAGGNRNVFSGRIGKSGVESAQRSPINLGGFAEAGAFLEHNYHNIRQPPSLTAGSSLNSSLAPPTPMSPRGGEMTLVKRDNARSSTSSAEGGMNYVFDTGVPGCFTSVEGGQNLASPPETPQNPMQFQQSLASGWPTGSDYDDKQWAYDVPDEPLYTPAHESFQQLELQMPQPSYLSTASQPVTPAFGQFNQQFMFGHESPQYKNDSPYSEYSFPEAYPQYGGGMSSVSPQTKQKTFQFSNTTPSDFAEK